MCHYANAHCAHLYVTWNNLRVEAKAEGNLWRGNPNLYQSSSSFHLQTVQSWGSPSCFCNHLSVFLVSSLEEVWGEGEEQELWYGIKQPPNSPSVDSESSVKGWPLHQLQLTRSLGRHSDPLQLTFRWLICDFWWTTSPSCALGIGEEQQGIDCSKRYGHVSLFQGPSLTRKDSVCLSVLWASWISEVMLISRCDISLNWRKHCLVHKSEEEQHLTPYHRRAPVCVGKLTSPQLLLSLFPHGSMEGMRTEHMMVQIQR